MSQTSLLRSLLAAVAVLAVVAFLAVAAGSCAPDPARRALDRAEAVMDTHPDSALAIIRAIDTATLHGDESRALYALLLSQALDKNIIDIASDSVIAPAYEYYALDPETDPRRRMLTFLYKGVVEYNSSNYSGAIFNFVIADSLADRIGDMKYRGIANAKMSLVYWHQLDVERDLEYSLKSLYFAQQCGDSVGIRMTIHNVAATYEQVGKYDSAMVYCRLGVFDDCYWEYGASLIGLGRLDEYAVHQDKYTGLRREPKIQIRYARGLIKADRINEARAVLDSAYSYLNDTNDTIQWTWAHSLLLRMTGDLSGYCDEADRLLQHQINRLTEVKATYSPTSQLAAKEFIYASEKLLDAKRRTILYRLIGLAVLVIVLAIFVAITIRNSANLKYERLKSQLAELNVSHSWDVATTRAELQRHNDADAHYIMERKANLDNLYERFILTPGTEKGDAHQSIVEEITSYSGREFNERLDRLINNRFEDYMERVNQSNLTKTDIAVLRLMICGFSNEQIGVILGSEKGAIATRRSRIKTKLAAASLLPIPRV